MLTRNQVSTNHRSSRTLGCWYTPFYYANAKQTKHVQNHLFSTSAGAVSSEIPGTWEKRTLNIVRGACSVFSNLVTQGGCVGTQERVKLLVDQKQKSLSKQEAEMQMKVRGARFTTRYARTPGVEPHCVAVQTQMVLCGCF
jgi:hypothetical protein